MVLRKMQIGKEPFSMEQSEDGMLVVECQSKPYYSLTNVARQYNKQSPSYVIQSWLRDRSTLEFLRIWEEDNNPNFRTADYLELLQRTKELAYRKWALKSTLFLNLLNDLFDRKLCFAADVIQLPNMLVKLGQKPAFHGMFNQLKQEYIFARYQYYQSCQIRDTQFADKDTYLITLQTIRNIQSALNKRKLHFASCILCQIRLHFSLTRTLNLESKNMMYPFVASGNPKKQEKAVISTEIRWMYLKLPLNAIYWICKDFYDNLYESPNPAAKELSDLRNSLDHKYVKVYLNDFSTCPSESMDDLAIYISEKNLNDLTLQLIQNIREALINLTLAVHVEGQRKKASLGIPFIPKIALAGYDNEKCGLARCT